jgi:hypothetical protein
MFSTPFAPSRFLSLENRKWMCVKGPQHSPQKRIILLKTKK